jgi:hypothetical protein
MHIRTDNEWKHFVYRYDVPKSVLAREFDWTDDDGFFKYQNTWYHLSQFEVLPPGPLRDAGWDGAHSTSMTTAILIKVSKDAEEHRRELPVMKTMLFVAAFLSFGCAGSFEETRGQVKVGAAPTATIVAVDPGYCRGLDSQHRAWGGVAKGSGAVAAGLGAGLIPSDESKELRIGLAAGAIGAGALAATSVFVSEDAASSYVRDCIPPSAGQAQ